jgi:hypothetical protein
VFRNLEEPYMRQSHSMELPHKPFMSQTALGLHVRDSRDETDSSSRSVSPHGARRPKPSSDLGQPSMNDKLAFQRPQTAEKAAQNGTELFQVLDVTSIGRHYPTDETIFQQPSPGKLDPSKQTSFIESGSKDRVYTNISGHPVPAAERSSIMQTSFSNKPPTIRHGSSNSLSVTATYPERTIRGGSASCGNNNGEASAISMDHAAASTSTRAYRPTPTISLPPPSLNCIGSPRLTPSLVMRHPPMPIKHLPTLPPPTPTQVDTSHTRLRSMPALPAEGPGDDEIDTDHEISGLGDSDEEDHGDVDSSTHDEGGLENDDRTSGSISSSQSSQSATGPPSPSFRPGFVLPSVDTSRIDLSFLQEPYISTSEGHRGRDVDETPTTSQAIDYFTPLPNGRGSPRRSPTGTPRQGDMHFSPFAIMQNLPHNQTALLEMPVPTSRGSLSRYPSKSMVDLSVTKKQVQVTAIVEEERTIVAEGKGKARESSDATVILSSESTSTLRQGKPIESPADEPPEPLRRRRSMPTFNRTSLPPPYPSFAPHPMSKRPIIMPREEEGMERLPSYTNAIHLTAIMPRKMEFTSPGVQAKDRKWRRVLCVLEGTVFKVYECPREAAGGVISQWWEKKVGVRDVSTVNTSNRKVEAVNPRSLETPAKLGPTTSPTNWMSPSRPSDSISRPNTSQRNLDAPFPQPSASSHIYSPSQGDIITEMRPNGSLSTINGSPSRGSNATHSSMTLPASPTASASASSSSHSHSHSAPIPSPRRADRRRSDQGKPVLMRAYTMQHAESGLGNDYTKRKNVIRLRLEGEQFLLQAQDVASVVEWIEVCEMCLTQNVLLIDLRVFKQQVM